MRTGWRVYLVWLLTLCVVFSYPVEEYDGVPPPLPCMCSLLCVVVCTRLCFVRLGGCR